MTTTPILIEQLKQYLAGTLPKEATDKLLQYISLEENRAMVVDAFCALGLEQKPDGNYQADRFEPMLELALNIDKTTASHRIEGLKHQKHKGAKQAAIVELPAFDNKQMIKARYSWMKYAAAVIVITIGATLYFQRSDKQKTDAPVVAASEARKTVPDEQATLILSDGSVIVLDSTLTGKLADQGSTRIIKLDAGGLAYDVGTKDSEATLYNTIKTPKGLQYMVVLPDGSTVWLNASSSIKFPTRFSGSNRTVEITGEVFFEVKKDTEKPFLVQTKHLGVTVLGTSFNINGYEDEPTSTLTLVNGSVLIKTNYGSLILKPGEQGYVENNQLKSKQVDVDLVTSWKEGIFDFNDQDLPALMRQIARWYDIEVKYEGAVPTMNFMGKVKRDLSFDGMLNVLKRAGVQFEVRDGSVLVIK